MQVRRAVKMTELPRPCNLPLTRARISITFCRRMTHRLPAQIDVSTTLAFLRERAQALGFSALGVSPAEELPSGVHLDAWLEAGYPGRMAYMHNHRPLRTNAAVLHPGAKTVISLTTPYRPLVLEDGRARIAAYAHGFDYHDILRAKLLTLLEELEAYLGFSVNGRPLVDSAPLLERASAERAGLGWFGRSAMLIHPERGTYTLLSELLIDLPLEEDVEPVRDHCGRCRRCVDACPTGAIVGDRVVDGSRCISYLTIELKGTIPRDLRSAIGEQMFGCDICQAVCPWNRFADDVQIDELAPREVLAHFDARDALQLDRAEFKALFKGSPLERTKRRGLARNAAVVLGNRTAAQDLPLLIHQLQTHDEPLVREHLVWAISRYMDHSDPNIQNSAHSALRVAFDAELDDTVRAELRWALPQPHFESESDA